MSNTSNSVTRINAPLNFRHTDTLTTTKVPHYPTKVTTGMSIIPGWNRPNANGINANINDKDYNGPDFKPRPLKQWRRQLRVYDFKGGANNSRAATISHLDRPGTTVYHFKPDCTCVTGEGGNSYIISNNKFGYETKDDNYSKAGSDVQIQNNGYNVVPYNATAAQINDPTNPAYKVLTGVYNTNCINCSPEGNIIKSGIALQNQAFYSYSNDKLESRCQTYEQNLSTNKAAGCVYFDAQGIPLWPNNAQNGPQVVGPVNYGSTTYKGNYFNLYDYPVLYNYGGIGSALQIQSASFIPKIKCRPVYVKAGFYVYPPSLAASIIAILYDNNNNIITSSNIQPAHISATLYPIPPSYYISIITFYFPENVYINPSTTYYILFKSVNNIPFDWFVVDYRIPNNTLAGTLVAEPLYCPSKTIYKPNNIGFAKQGAVSGSTRLKKLVSDTVSMNGSSYYSAFGAHEANLGKYQGTNISGNYFIKTKEVHNSCIGTKPEKLILSVIDIEPNSITFSWEDIGSTLCKISYYTLIYYAIRILGNIRDLSYDAYGNGNVKQITNARSEPIVGNVPIYDDAIYTDVDNNIRYTIISKIYAVEIAPSTTNTYILKGLDSATAYIAYINGTNGNGTSDNSNKVQTETTLNPNLVINIAPPYSYEYNDLPKILSGSVSSDTQLVDSSNIIITAITNATNTNVAYIYNNNNIQKVFKVLVQNAGYFNIYAIQRKFGIYGTATAVVPITIIKSTPTISFTNTINRDLIYGRTYMISNAIIGNTNKKINDGKKILLNYKPSNNSSATIKTDATTNSDNPVLYVTGMGPFYIIIKTILNQLLSQNYNSVTYNTNTFTVVKSSPSIIQSSKLVTTGTYGSPYTFYPPSINYNPTIQPAGSIPQIILYSITNASPPGIASIDALGNVTINGAGTFNISAYCNITSIYNATSLSLPLPIITINKQTPIIKFSYTLPKPLFITAVTYDVSYNLVPAKINNNVQTLSYTVVNSAPHNNVVNISTIYDNTNTIINSSSVQYLPPQSNTIQKISYGIIKPTYEGLLNSISFKQLNANITKNYYIVSVQSDTHNVNINYKYSTYSNLDGRSSTATSPTTVYPAFPGFSTDILSTPKDDVYINNISIALAYPASVGVTSYFACDLFVKDIITGLPVNLTNNPLSSIQLPVGIPVGALYMYNISCNVILTETQLANATLVIKSGSNASYYPSTTTGNMYIEINYISILTSKCSIISIPANVTTVKNFDLTGFSVMMHPTHSYTISLWLIGNIIQNVLGYDIYSGSGTVCSTSTAPLYIYGTVSQGIPITTVTNIATPFYFNSVGKFKINASCNTTSNYKANNIDSKKVVIAIEIPVITFSNNLITTCVYNIGFVLPIPIATVNNNIQIVNYSIVNVDDDDVTASTVANINPEGTQLLINSVGTFKINASVIETTSLDFSHASALSIPIVISPATPIITFASTFIKQVTYFKNSTYQILGVSTTNTDNPAPILSYSSSNPNFATISGNIVTIISVGSFYINVSCTPTTNFNGLSGTTSVKSPIINIKKATPVINFSQGFGSSWGFNSATPYSLTGTGITCNNTDSSDIKYTYKILSPSRNNVAQLIPPAQIKINNAGSFTLEVISPVTQNFNSSSEHIIIIIPQLTPIIIFPKKLVSPWKYGEGLYIFNPANISNNDPSQIITYSIIPISSPNNIAVASFLDPTKPSVTINSVGTFKIQASCVASTDGNYTASNKLKPCISRTISIGGEIPIITFSSSLIGSTNITYAYNLNSILPYPIATVVNNTVQTQSYFTYSVVEADSDIGSDVSPVLSPFASISSNNASLIVNSVGSFRIYAQVAHSINHDYSSNENYSGIITVNPATPTFPPTLAIPSSWVYNEKYNIPYPTTSNTDPNLVFSYSIKNKDNSNIASVPVSGTTVTIIGVGKFQISVSIMETTNYTSATYTYPSPSTYYTSIKATPIIKFPDNFVKSLIYSNNYALLPVIVTNNDPLTQPITYSIYPTTSTVASIKYINGSPYVTILSIGKFKISASCPMSTNGYYKAVLRGQVLSPTIKISTDIPKVTFNTNNFSSSYVYVYNSPLSIPSYNYNLSAPIASINPSNTNQTLRYSIVTDNSTKDSIIPSTIATITSNGTYLNTNKVGIFKIYTQADETPSLDYGECSLLSNIITVTKAIPTITSSTLVISPPPPFIYGSTYNIPYPSTSNTDASTSADIVSYSTDYLSIVSITGTNITIIGVGKFNIKVKIAATTNYSSPPLFIYPSSSSYYTSIEATPVITFPQTIVKSALYGSPYTFIAANISNYDPSSQKITYSIISISPPNTIVAYFLDPTKPSVTILSAGTFQIKASCAASANGYYSATNQLFPLSPSYITVTREVPNIVFNPANFNNSYVYSYSNALIPTPYTFTSSSPIASITNNTVQTLTYSAVEVDSYTPSTVATISSVGTSLTTTGVGKFRICAQTSNIGLDYGAGHVFSNSITINPAIPTIQSFSALSPPPIWVYSSITLQTYSIAYPITSNTDTPVPISYNILTPSNTTIGTVSGTNITSIGVGQFQISVTVAATTNYISPPPFIYPSPSTYYTFVATPIIRFSQKRFPSGVYGSPYTFTAANIVNNDPSQTITYSITSISPPNTVVASFANNTIPSITILSGGTFLINASCLASTNGYYLPSSNPSSIISITREVPNIVFNAPFNGNGQVYPYSTLPYTYSSSTTIASITPNPGGQILTYSTVAIDNDDKISNVATISSDGTSITTNTVGSFRILVETASIGLDYGAGNIHSGIITVTQATPTITSQLVIPSSWVYDSSYNIPYPSTSNTDVSTSAQIVSYSTDNPDIISISGTNITIIGVGNFNIKVTISATTNYSSPLPFIYSYTSIQETTDLEFPGSFHTSATFDTPYIFIPAQLIIGDPSTQTITYSIQ
uniref:Uncharacterized protein n=1 Tax=viral metagenome TaxID=1070528 RepID=A0A6C0EZ04_9ZZZZ